MQKKLRLIPFYTLLVLLSSTGLSGCAGFKFPGVYRIGVLQGNIIDQKKVDQLEIGMTKRQVQFVMGSPLLNDVFHEDRWDYIYQLRHGEDTLRDRRFTLFFENDALLRYEGDYEPHADAPVEEDTYIEDAEKTQG